MQASRYFVALAAELGTRMKDGEHNFSGCQVLVVGMIFDWDAAAVV